MLRLTIPLLALTLALSACSEKAGFSSLEDAGNSGIVGGSDVLVPDDKSPSVVLIYGEKPSGDPYVCTGTFISRKVILTAAHCVVKKIETMSVLFGLQPFLKDATALKIQSVKQHEDYHPNSQSDRNDIALIFLADEAPEDAKIAPLFTQKIVPEFLEAYGYGRTDGIEESPTASEQVGTLRRVDLKGSALGFYDDSLLQYNQQSGQGMCYGDSGGPLFTTQGEIVGVGSAIVGDGKNADECKYLSFFTNVEFYLDWINLNRNPL